VINNVITLATVPIIFARGAAFYRTSAWAARAARCRERCMSDGAVRIDGSKAWAAL